MASAGLDLADGNVRPESRVPAAPPDCHAGGTNQRTQQFLSKSGFGHCNLCGREVMLGWAITFLVIALIAAVLGFGGIAGLSMEIAKIIFFVAILLFAIAAIVGLLRGRTPTVP